MRQQSTLSRRQTENSGYAGYFYAVQLVPELSLGRIKFGWSADPRERLLEHRTASPTARLLKVWGCEGNTEGAALDFVMQFAERALSREVFDIRDVPDMVARLDEFLAAPVTVHRRHGDPFLFIDGVVSKHSLELTITLDSVMPSSELSKWVSRHLCGPPTDYFLRKASPNKSRQFRVLVEQQIVEN